MWRVNQIDSWFDFCEFLYEKGYFRLCNENSLLVNPETMEERDKHGIIMDNFRLEISPSSYMQIFVIFTGKDADVGINLVKEYKDSLSKENSLKLVRVKEFRR